MKLDEIKTFKNKTSRDIREGKLYVALQQMRAFSDISGDWELGTSIDNLMRNYSYMLQYVATGVDDPGQKEVYDNLVTEALALVDTLTRKAYMAENPALYYSVARTMGTKNTIQSLVADYLKECTRLDHDIESIADPGRTEHAENILRDLFNKIWTQHPLKTDDIAAILTLLDRNVSPCVGLHARCLVVSAIMMGLLEFYDSKRLELLLSIYLSDDDDNVRLRAFIGAMAVFYRYRSRPLSKDVALKLAAVKDSPDWEDDFIAVTAEFMRTVDTDRISADMQQKMTDAIKNMDPELKKKLQSGDIDMEALTEGNPEWEEKFSKSDLVRNLKEFQDIQADGGDVFMASFSNMKQFPFFSDMSNWFLPFYENYSAVSRIDNFEGTIGYLLGKMPILCDSDKYSVIMAFSSVPAANRETFVKAMDMQSEQMREALSAVEKVSPVISRRNIINKYVQDMHRFYKLFRRKGEFFPLFSGTPNLLEVKALGSGFDNAEKLEVIAAFYFKHEFWPQAIAAYKILDNMQMPDAARAQKLGYAYEMTGNLGDAVAKYEEAELLDGNSTWTLKRIAGVLRRYGQSKSAAVYYKRLSDMYPDDGNLVLNYGYALSEAGATEDAEAQFHKAAYLMPDSFKPLRGLAWIQFRNKKYDAAMATYSRVLPAANDEDYLNYGHVLLATGDVKGAIEAYREYEEKFGKDIAAALNADQKYLSEAGVDADKLPLIIETVKYNKL